MYIFVFKYLNTSFAAIPRERVRKIFRRLFTEPLLPLREARRFLLRLPSIPFDSLERKSWLCLLLLLSSLLFLFLAFPFPFPFSPSFFIERRRFHRATTFPPSYFLLSRVFLPDDKALNGTKWRDTVFLFESEKKRGGGEEGEREEKKVIKRIGEKFASSSDNTRFRQPTVDYFYARTQLFIVQRIIRSIRPLRHSHYEN